MTDSPHRLTPQQRDFARALSRRVQVSSAPDEAQLNALFDDLSRVLRHEEERLRYTDALSQLRRCAAAVIVLGASISLSLWSSGSADAQLAQQSTTPTVQAPAMCSFSAHSASAASAPTAPSAPSAAAAAPMASAAHALPAAVTFSDSPPAPEAPAAFSTRATFSHPAPHAAANAILSDNARISGSDRLRSASKNAAAAAPAKRIHLDILPLR